MALIAVCIFAFSDRPMGGVAMFFCAVAMGFGAWLLVQPFLKNQEAELRGRDLDSLNPVSDQLRRLEELRHLLSETVAKAPVAKDYEPTLKEISSAIESIREAHESSYEEIKNSWTQDIAGLETRALHAIQSIQKVPSGEQLATFSAPIPVTPAPAPEIKPDMIAGIVSDKLRPEWTAESEKTLTAMKEHVDESFSQAMSEMADLKLALEQALETIANAAPGAISVTAPAQPARADTEKVKELMTDLAVNLDSRLKSQARSVQKLSTEVGGLRRMMRRAMNVKGGSWNVELATDETTEPQSPEIISGNDSEAGSDFEFNIPAIEDNPSEWNPFTPEPEISDSVSTEPATQPDPNDLLVYPSGSFPSPDSFGGMDEEVLPTQFTEDTPESEAQVEVPSESESQIEEPSATEAQQEDSQAAAETSDEEVVAQPSDSISEEDAGDSVEKVEAEEPSPFAEEAPEEPAQVSPEIVQDEVSVSEETLESQKEATQESPTEAVESEPEVAESDVEESVKTDNEPKKQNAQKLPSVKSAVRNLFEEAEQDEDPE